jgi:hypothetical protein
MFTESLALVPSMIGLAVYGTLGLVIMIWFLTRTKPLHVSNKTTVSR